MDFGLKVHGFPAENVTDGSVLVVKTHEAPPLEPDKFKSAVLLIRNPRDAILVKTYTNLYILCCQFCVDVYFVYSHLCLRCST